LEHTTPNTVEREAKFDINELFFSITTHDSTILSGNEVFIRISGYTKEELVGQFHNVIRHPAMPRVLFKVIWETIQAQKPIAGYVLNRTKSGEHYWVFAALFPLNDRYVSIRIKPTSRFFAYAQELYPVFLAAERRGGMEASEALIPEVLNSIGYQSYHQFMSDALLEELKGRKDVVSFEPSRSSAERSALPFYQHLQTVHGYTKELMEKYDGWFEKIDMFNQVESLFKEKSLVLRQVAREVVFLSLNASVSSYKVENGGETFGILARDVRTNAKENDELIAKIDCLVQELSGSLSALVFSVSGIRLQSEMLTYFISELLCENCNVEHHEIEENMDALISLVAQYAKKTDELQLTIEGQVQEIRKNLDHLERQIMYLGYIQVYGIIEAAGAQNETVSFEGIFSQLKTLIQKTSQEVEEMQKLGGNFDRENTLLRDQSVSITHVLNSLHNEIEVIKQLEG
jgi:PAS domain S-box-containing protein